FWAPWCGPCHMVSPIVEQLAKDYSGRLKVAKLNTDEAQHIAVQFGIQSIPSLVLIKNGQEVDRMIGARPKQAIADWIDSKL
ncbi:MAG TPA: thioredoxin, partial [Firmicutes bacterium]|nr:thioredoxin [Bacillota bacterium]